MLARISVPALEVVKFLTSWGADDRESCRSAGARCCVCNVLVRPTRIAGRNLVDARRQFYPKSGGSKFVKTRKACFVRGSGAMKQNPLGVLNVCNFRSSLFFARPQCV